nr:ATP-binding protein [Halovenus salina]
MCVESMRHVELSRPRQTTGQEFPTSRTFTSFRRVREASRVRELEAGLYLVQTLVDRYGGAVIVEDNDPGGSVFILELRREQ